MMTWRCRAAGSAAPFLLWQVLQRRMEVFVKEASKLQVEQQVEQPAPTVPISDASGPSERQHAAGSNRVDMVDRSFPAVAPCAAGRQPVTSPQPPSCVPRRSSETAEGLTNEVRGYGSPTKRGSKKRPPRAVEGASEGHILAKIELEQQKLQAAVEKRQEKLASLQAAKHPMSQTAASHTHGSHPDSNSISSSRQLAS